MSVNRAILLFMLLIIFTNCGLQKPAPVLIKGEEFYGKRNLEHSQEYSLTRENVKQLKKKRGKKIIISKACKDNSYMPNVEINCKFVMPIKGIVKSSTRICQDGVQISSYRGASVVASAPGKVIYVGKGLRFYGNLAVIEHQNNYTTVYSYLRNIYIKIGDDVKQGQIIGLAGKLTIQDKELQMCFTIRHNGQAVDPLLQINCWG